MKPETRLSISVDTKLVFKLQATIQLKENRHISIAEVVRIALQQLAKANNVAA